MGDSGDGLLGPGDAEERVSGSWRKGDRRTSSVSMKNYTDGAAVG